MKGSDLLTNTACGYACFRRMINSEYFSLYCLKMYLLSANINFYSSLISSYFPGMCIITFISPKSLTSLYDLSSFTHNVIYASLSSFYSVWWVWCLWLSSFPLAHSPSYLFDDIQRIVSYDALWHGPMNRLVHVLYMHYAHTCSLLHALVQFGCYRHRRKWMC